MVVSENNTILFNKIKAKPNNRDNNYLLTFALFSLRHLIQFIIKVTLLFVNSKS